MRMQNSFFRRVSACTFVARLLAGLCAFHLAYADSPSEELAAHNTSPPNVIFDTDMYSDIDDMLALAMLHALHDRHEINLVAVTVSTDEKSSAAYVDMIDTFYGHPQILVGIVHNGFTVEQMLKRFPPTKDWPEHTYYRLMSQRTNPDGALMYPHRLIDGSQAPEAVSLLRKTLAAQPDKSVVMIQVGYSTNLARLLDSKADGASALDGQELVRRRVRLLSVMAGNFKEPSPEWNNLIDIQAAQKVFSSWPTPIVDSGGEIGGAMAYPGLSIKNDYSYVRHHPIADTYLLYCESRKSALLKGKALIKGCPHDHPTFDLTSVLYAARPDRDYFSLSKPGKITVLADGGTRFDESDGGTHRYLILSEEQKARTLEAMVMLASQPPVHVPQP